MPAPNVVRLAVVGAGVIGLSCAVQLQAALPHASVTIIAEHLNEQTVSDGAAGSFRPTGDLIGGLSRETLLGWCKDSFEFYSQLAHSAEASQAGVSVISGHHFFVDKQKEKDPIYSEVVYNYHECSEKEMNIYPQLRGAAHFGAGFTTLMVECRWFLPWLLNKFKQSNGHLEIRKLGHLGELVGLYDVVINCSGLGSRQLVGDEALRPIRGQMIRVKAPWIKQFLYVDNHCWIIPGKETVVIGGTRQEDETDTTVRPADSQLLWQVACKYMPSLKNATWQWEWAGIRPVREPIRVEAETMSFGGNKKLHVVHNYGHGGNGVSLAWGTSKQAVQLVVDILKPRRLSAHL